MANYNAVVRTNYFEVTDEERYQKLYARLTSEDNICDFTEQTKDGRTVHGFGAYATIQFTPSDVNEDDEDYDLCGIYDFAKELQEILPDGEAFVCMEAGYENLRYVTGFGTVATNKAMYFADMHDILSKCVKEMTNDTAKPHTLKFVY